MKRYSPKDIEPKWQKKWAETNLYAAEDYSAKLKYVMLTEFPYPSGAGMHIGHMREYSLGDIVARYKRMQGYNVLFPMGFDAFGLPTENYAIKNKITPQKATEDNVTNFVAQLQSMGFSFDWSRRFNTSDPDYYRWTQWLFLRFVKAGLAYQAEIAVNWCPFCKTGLANEEVVNGRHERCDTPVEKKLLKQWMLRITDYADRLIDGLDTVDYPSRIADQQINWIGRSKGAEIDFAIENSDTRIKVFTTRPDTIFGATALVLAPEHPLVIQLTSLQQKEHVNAYIKSAAAKSDVERQDTDRDKTGVFSGSYAINPASGEKIPVYVADYVLTGYGTGAIMSVPAHDERDYAFAVKYGLNIVPVIRPKKAVKTASEPVFTAEGVMFNSGKYDGLASSDMREQIVKDLAEQGVAQEKINYRLRDWIFSRQHYWGEPIPIIHCPKHGAVQVPEDALPVELPKVAHYEPTHTGESPLAAIEDWVNTTCPKCGGPAKRETDTMPNWAGSSWYYLRYFDPHNAKAFADRKLLDYWGAVDMYLGGMEHTTLHLLYSRFWHEFFYDEGLVPTPEPYAARRGQGIILAADGTKMSKSKGNIVNPNDVIDNGYGADALRLAITFLAPYDQTTPWSPEALGGTFRFLQRLWTLVNEYVESDGGESESDDLKRVVNRTIRKVDQDLLDYGFNTAIATLMECVNQLYRIKAKDNFSSIEWQWAIESTLKLVAPFAPHICEELWEVIGNDGSIHLESWPAYDPAWTIDQDVVIAVQINGKIRGEVKVQRGADQKTVLAAAEREHSVKNYLAKKEITRVIYVPDKLLSLVIN